MLLNKDLLIKMCVSKVLWGKEVNRGKELGMLGSYLSGQVFGEKQWGMKPISPRFDNMPSNVLN